MMKVCCEADGDCEERVAAWFTKYQVLALKGTCLQRKRIPVPCDFVIGRIHCTKEKNGHNWSIFRTHNKKHNSCIRFQIQRIRIN